MRESDEMSCVAHHFTNATVANVRVTRSNAGIDCFTCDDLGIKIPPRCKRCEKLVKDCKDCKFEAHQLSRREQQEQAIIRSNLKLDPVQQRFITEYPYKCDPSILKDNRVQAVGLMKATERRLARN